jgi:hypothetical protein
MTPHRTEVQHLGNGYAKVADFDLSLANGFLVPVGTYTTGSIHLRVTAGTASTVVVDVIVSNDPSGSEYGNHPSGLQLTTNTMLVPFEVPFGFVGLFVTTPQSGLKADVFIRLCKP